jgi:hypothetical protein
MKLCPPWPRVIAISLLMDDSFLIKTRQFVNALRKDQRVAHVGFFHNGMYGTPGRKRVYERLLLDLWKTAGAVESVVYDTGYCSCVITYEESESVSRAIKAFNKMTTLQATLDEISGCYSDEGDKLLARELYKKFFIEHEGCYIRVVSFPTRGAMLARKETGF